MTIAEAIRDAEKKIQHRSIEKNAILLIVEETQGFSNRTELYLHLQDPLQNVEQFQTYLMELISGKPVQYILKKAWFCDHVFYVDSRVLVPRMETEELVEKVYELAKNIEQPLIYDICTGSGCIALSLASRLEHAQIYAGDISNDALEVAKINQQQLNLESVKFLESNLLCAFPHTRADIIVSNPPYVDEKEILDASVKNYEPRIALVPPSGNGLEFYQRLFVSLPIYLKEGGYFCAEFGETQREALSQLADKLLPNSKITFYQDMQKKDRFFVLQYFRSEV